MPQQKIKYQQDNILLTKEAMINHALEAQKKRAEECGLTLEEYMVAVTNGKVITIKLK